MLRTSGAAIVCAAMTVGGCVFQDDQLGSGPQSTKDFSQKRFDRISANGSMDVTVKVGGTEGVTTEGDQDRIDNLTMSVEDGRLVIKEESPGWFGNHGKLHVTVTLPNLIEYEMNGSGDASVEGVDSDDFIVSVNGSGDVHVVGTAAKCVATVNGSGDMDLSGLKTKVATVSIAGSGDVSVDASEALEVSIAGSGDVQYSGDPKLTSQIAGSGNIEKR